MIGQLPIITLFFSLVDSKADAWSVESSAYVSLGSFSQTPTYHLVPGKRCNSMELPSPFSKYSVQIAIL